MNTEEPIKGARNELNVVISSTTFLFTELFMSSPDALYYMRKDIIITYIIDRIGSSVLKNRVVEALFHFSGTAFRGFQRIIIWYFIQ